MIILFSKEVPRLFGSENWEASTATKESRSKDRATQ